MNIVDLDLDVECARALALDAFLERYIECDRVTVSITDIFVEMHASESPLLAPFVDWEHGLDGSVVVRTLFVLTERIRVQAMPMTDNDDYSMIHVTSSNIDLLNVFVFGEALISTGVKYSRADASMLWWAMRVADQVTGFEVACWWLMRYEKINPRWWSMTRLRRADAEEQAWSAERWGHTDDRDEYTVLDTTPLGHLVDWQEAHPNEFWRSHRMKCSGRIVRVPGPRMREILAMVPE